MTKLNMQFIDTTATSVSVNHMKNTPTPAKSKLTAETMQKWNVYNMDLSLKWYRYLMMYYNMDQLRKI